MFSRIHRTILITGVALHLALLFTGCASSYTSEVAFNPLEPIRVVVLPFAQVGEDGSVKIDDSAIAVDQVALISTPREDSPEEIVRKAALQTLARTSLDVVAPAVVDAELVHHGFGKKDLSVDRTALFAAAPAEICTHMLACDAVLYGRIINWSRDYYAIQTVNSVTLDLRLVGARDSKLLFRSQATDTESRGITKGPTGYSNLVLEPIKGLDSEIIAQLSERMVQRMLAPLTTDSRPEFLKSAPPAIFAAAHDVPSGVLVRTDPLTVLAFGSPNQTASFSLGDTIQNIPMFERDPGNYIGEYFPLPTDSFDSQQIVVHITDSFGRTTSRPLRNPPVTLR